VVLQPLGATSYVVGSDLGRRSPQRDATRPESQQPGDRRGR
jgi:hypothetical protein